MRVAAFVSGGVIAPSARGKQATGLATLADVWGTLCALALADPVDHTAAASGLLPVDGMDLSEMITGRNITASRRQQVPLAPLKPNEVLALEAWESACRLFEEQQLLLRVAPTWDVHHASCGQSNANKIDFIHTGVDTIAGCEAACARLELSDTRLASSTNCMSSGTSAACRSQPRSSAASSRWPSTAARWWSSRPSGCAFRPRGTLGRDEALDGGSMADGAGGSRDGEGPKSSRLLLLAPPAVSSLLLLAPPPSADSNCAARSKRCSTCDIDCRRSRFVVTRYARRAASGLHAALAILTLS